MYSKLILENFDAASATELNAVGARVYQALGGSKHMGGRLQLLLAVADNTIQDLQFRADGGVVLLACANWLCNRLKNQSLTAATELNRDIIIQNLQIAAKDSLAADICVQVLAEVLCQIH